jgi:signal transduction histidine kinase
VPAWVQGAKRLPRPGEPGWPGRPNAKRRDPSGAFGVLALCVLMCATMTLGWFLAEALFRFTGRPPALAAYMVGVALGLALCALAAFVASLAAKKGQLGQWTLGDRILEALERIGRGEFDIHIENAGRSPFGDVVDSVNSMARQLGTLEQQRQDFISAVSHEIQSPLTSITGFAGLLRDLDLDEETRRHYLDVIAAECARLSALGANLLRLSALDEAEIGVSPFALDEQLRDVILTLEPQWSDRRVAVELDALAAGAHGDPDLLRQVWVNLVHNAIKFTPPGGQIEVQVTPWTSKTTPGGAESGWRVDVRDSGDGIASTDLPHIFERFYRGDRARAAGGNGLGLALAKRIVDLHGGRITAASAPGQGSTFTVYLP